MSPFPSQMDAPSLGTVFNPELLARGMNSLTELKSQWHNPTDILSFLLLLGPDIIQRAIAQQVGHYITPIAFSFGWVAYSLGALISVFGGGRLMPPADFRAYVIGAKSGHVRSNKSWIIGRLLRDYEQQADPLCTEKDSRDWEALRVAVYRTAPSTQSGRPVRDWVWFSGLGMIFVQLSIAIVPLCLFGDFIVLFVTVAANALTLSHGLSAQWKKEKWACPKGGGHTVTITQGNGSRHAMVILGGREALDLSILAYCDGNSSCSSATRILAAVQSTCWGALLLTVAGLKQGAWYLLVIGTIGMLQNVFVAGYPRKPEALGVHLTLVEIIRDTKVANVLARVEQQYPLVGTSLLPVFYPAGFRAPNEQRKFWKEARARRQQFISDINADSVEPAIILSETQEQILQPGSI